MAVIAVQRDVPRPLWAVWAVVADVAGHRLPLTRVHTDPGRPGVGWRFRAVTGVGPLRFTDAMVLTQWCPPTADSDHAGYAVVKTGPVLSGWAQVSLQARGAAGTRLRWREEIVAHPHALGRLAQPLSDRAVQLMFDRAVTEMLRRA